jgi:hypothetical protein
VTSVGAGIAFSDAFSVRSRIADQVVERRAKWTEVKRLKALAIGKRPLVGSL